MRALVARRMPQNLQSKPSLLAFFTRCEVKEKNLQHRKHYATQTIEHLLSKDEFMHRVIAKRVFLQ